MPTCNAMPLTGNVFFFSFLLANQKIKFDILHYLYPPIKKHGDSLNTVQEGKISRLISAMSCGLQVFQLITY